MLKKISYKKPFNVATKYTNKHRRKYKNKYYMKSRKPTPLEKIIGSFVRSNPELFKKNLVTKIETPKSRKITKFKKFTKQINSMVKLFC